MLALPRRLRRRPQHGAEGARIGFPGEASRVETLLGDQEAVARIEYAIATRALAAVTGEVGAGKTLAVRAAVARLDTSRHQFIYLPNPHAGARGYLQAIVSALGGIPRFHHATLIPQAADALAAELTERGSAGG